MYVLQRDLSSVIRPNLFLSVSLESKTQYLDGSSVQERVILAAEDLKHCVEGISLSVLNSEQRASASEILTLNVSDKFATGMEHLTDSLTLQSTRTEDLQILLQTNHRRMQDIEGKLHAAIAHLVRFGDAYRIASTRDYSIDTERWGHIEKQQSQLKTVVDHNNILGYISMILLAIILLVIVTGVALASLCTGHNQGAGHIEGQRIWNEQRVLICT